LADKIKIVPADFQKALAELQRIEALLNDHKAELSGKYSMMMNDWQGMAGEAFAVCAQKVLNDFEINITNIGQLTVDIEQAGQFMEEVDRNIAGVVSFA